MKKSKITKQNRSDGKQRYLDYVMNYEQAFRKQNQVKLIKAFVSELLEKDNYHLMFPVCHKAHQNHADNHNHVIVNNLIVPFSLTCLKA